MTSTKHCPRCVRDLPVAAFGFRDTDHTKVQSYCRNCQNAASRGWYAKPENRSRHKKLVRNRRRQRILRHRTLVAELKSQPCADCGNRYPPYVMDFDHVREKTTEVSRMVHTVGTEALLAEIEKCDVVCSNCHRVRTHRRASEDRPTE